MHKLTLPIPRKYWKLQGNWYLNFAAAAAELRVDARDEELVDVNVTCDGTWSKRGFMVLYGVVVVASWDTSKVLE